MSARRNDINYKLPVGIKQKTPLWFIAVLCLLSFSTVFFASGLANQIKLNERVCYLSIFAFLFWGGSGAPILKPIERYTTVFMVAVMSLLAFLNYDSRAYQLIQLTSTFGMVLFVHLFCRIAWEEKNYSLMGIAISIVTIIFAFLLSPGRLFSGWNPNSIAGTFPLFAMAACMFLVSEYKWKWIYMIVLFLIYISQTLQLANRSTLIAIIAFLIILITKEFTQNKYLFRLLYVGIILLNVLLPFFNLIFSDMGGIHDLIGSVSEMTDVTKMDVSAFNGREDLWLTSIEIQKRNPLFGTFGIRPLYPHNFSMDLLNNFGWVGYLTFISLFVSVLEYAYLEGSKYNIFLVGFLAVLFLNTFENMFTCCNYMEFFVYCLPAITIRMNQRLIKV